ncbi:hypothetical protein DTO96_100331 [Ephemeroptericola cinctiostellae]|uniref:Uncharacterized protein n=1 Tax=Ephemeroptericola cinctiostellae TaxID=2268024 RepID=A0A345D8D3_9BURK|nr:hypothetical protein [Ephemeroptericola cinctiostellae]AXF84621.1 hypothetical protein DTO96_100331 [Ephemeroptericola cinctiostellae]
MKNNFIKMAFVFSGFFSSIAQAQSVDNKLTGLSELELIKQKIMSSTSEKLFLGSGITQIKDGVAKYRLAQGGYFSSGTSMKGAIRLFQSWCSANNGDFTQESNKVELSYFLSNFLYSNVDVDSFGTLLCKTSKTNHTWLYSEKTLNQRTSYDEPEKYIYVFDDNARTDAINKGVQLRSQKIALDASNSEKYKKLQTCLNQEKSLALKNLNIGSKLQDESLIIDKKNDMFFVQAPPLNTTSWILKTDLTMKQLVDSKKCKSFK